LHPDEDVLPSSLSGHDGSRDGKGGVSHAVLWRA
jgi:hypothetical protein